MERVLLINDSKFEIMIMSDMLDSLGYEVKASTEYEAMLDVKIFQPDIVIANLIMKTIRGDELIQKIKGYDSHVKCILCSSNNISLSSFLSKKVDGVLHTPTNKDKIEHVIDNIRKIEELRKQDAEKKPIKPPVITIVEEKTIHLEPKKKEAPVLQKVNEKIAEVEGISKGTVEETQQKKMLFCPYCGTKFPDKEVAYKFCPECGLKL